MTIPVNLFKDSTGNNDEAFFSAVTSEATVLEERIKAGDITFPLVRVFDKNSSLVAEIILRDHNDEASYRNALMEVALVMPSLGVYGCSIFFKTVPDGYGLIHLDQDKVTGTFFGQDGSRITEDEFRPEFIDAETVTVLDQFTKTPIDSSYVHENLAVLGRRGHKIEVFQDLEKLDKILIM